ncbi:metal-dependent hydrolase [Methyloprofundus sedimenti]|uniref:metal-dependent hydrolase n=1 Tax=Methyloprofundus sedimenti TaxID=1420851 RepID=UPI0009B6392A|nr:metal-dependent hydrolase [Methyloprofundus sedimenti]
MANFKTHLSVASIASSGAASLAVNIQLIDLLDAPWLILVGTIGGLLPDIDSDNSKPAKLLFLLLAIISALTVLSIFSISHEITELFNPDKLVCDLSIFNTSSLLSALSEKCISLSLLLIVLTTFVIVRYLLFAVFNSLTVHRGVFHSILAAIFFALLVTCIAHFYLQQTIEFSWLSGLFVCIGFIVHLLLDEVFSVDLSNSRMKKSFGTALKLCSYNSWSASIIMLLCTLTLYYTSPPLASTINRIYLQIAPTQHIAFEGGNEKSI